MSKGVESSTGIAALLSESDLVEYRTEIQELLDSAEEGLLAIEQGAKLSAHYDGVLRVFHNIKGATAMLDLKEISQKMHDLEQRLIELKQKDTLTKDQIDLFLAGCDEVRRGMGIPILERAEREENSEARPNTAADPAKDEDPMQAALQEFYCECEELLDRIYKIVRHGEREGFSPQILGELYRDVHTIKGSSQLCGLNEIGSLAHTIEGVLEPHRQTGLPKDAAFVTKLYRALDLIEDLLVARQGGVTESRAELSDELAGILLSLKSSDAPTEEQIEAPSPGSNPAPEASNSSLAPAEGRGAVRVSVALLDRLMNLVGEMVLVRNQVLQFSNQSENLEFLNLSQRLNLVTSEIQGEVMKTRMQPIGNVIGKFQRVVRDLSAELGKKIDLTISGADTELDKTLLEAIKDPLMHILRNSCDHGVEAPVERKRIGKAERGRISVRSHHEGGQVVIEISDDGRGLNREKLIAKALEKGLITSERASEMSDAEAHQLIFMPGLSTASQVTSVSGRGVGMDVARTNIERIGGVVELETEPGQGSTFRLKIPLTLAIIPALIIRCGRDRYAVPQVKLVELIRIGGDPESKIERLHGSPVYRLRGRILPVVELGSVLKIHGASEGDTAADGNEQEGDHILVLNFEGKQFGLRVDEILDTADIVVKPLNGFLKSLSTYSGATILGDGSVSLILDVVGLAQAARLSSSLESEKVTQSDAPESGKDAGASLETEYLLFSAGERNRFAIPLSDVHRLEEFDAGEVEVSGAQRVIRYRDSLLPLLSVEDALQLRTTSSRQEHGEKSACIVIRFHDRLVGLEVAEILDVVSTSMGVDRSVADRPGILGNLVTKNGVLVVIDTKRILNAFVEKVTHGRPALLRPNLVQSSTPKSKARVLYVEDMAFLRRQVAEFLESSGLDVITAEDGEEALSKVNETVDLVISDIEMPKMNGLELAKALRQDQRFVATPLLALSSRAEPSDVEAGLQSGFDAYLPKLDRAQLHSTVLQLIETGRRRRKEAA